MRQLLHLFAKEKCYRISLFRNFFFAIRQPLHFLAKKKCYRIRLFRNFFFAIRQLLRLPTKEKCYRISLFRNFFFAIRQLLHLLAKENCYRIRLFEISSSLCGSFYTFSQRKNATASTLLKFPLRYAAAVTPSRKGELLPHCLFFSIVFESRTASPYGCRGRGRLCRREAPEGVPGRLVRLA